MHAHGMTREHTQVPEEHFLRAAHRVVFAIDREADRLLEKHGRTFSQFLVMTGLATCPSGPQHHIAEFLNVTPAAVSRLIGSLVEEGLATRASDPDNRRANIVRLSAEGTQAYGRMKKVLIHGFREKIGSVSVPELERATRTLDSIVRAFGPAEHAVSNQ